MRNVVTSHHAATVGSHHTFTVVAHLDSFTVDKVIGRILVVGTDPANVTDDTIVAAVDNEWCHTVATEVAFHIGVKMLMNSNHLRPDDTYLVGQVAV